MFGWLVAIIRRLNFMRACSDCARGGCSRPMDAGASSFPCHLDCRKCGHHPLVDRLLQSGAMRRVFFVVARLLLIPLVLAPSLLTTSAREYTLRTCNVSEDTEIDRPQCMYEHSALVSLACFWLVRLISLRVEIRLAQEHQGCGVRAAHPGIHPATATALPFLIRTISVPTLASSIPIRVFIFVLTVFLFLPFLNDFYISFGYLGKALQKGFFQKNRDAIRCFLLSFAYFVILFLSFVDISLGVLCPSRIFGVSVLFPAINFPLILFLIHSFIFDLHKRMPIIIYEVLDRDIFVQWERHRCLNDKNCLRYSEAFRLTLLPSQASTTTRRQMVGRIVAVRDMDELEKIIPVSIK